MNYSKYSIFRFCFVEVGEVDQDYAGATPAREVKPATRLLFSAGFGMFCFSKLGTGSSTQPNMSCGKYQYSRRGYSAFLRWPWVGMRVAMTVRLLHTPQRNTKLRRSCYVSFL